MDLHLRSQRRDFGGLAPASLAPETPKGILQEGDIVRRATSAGSANGSPPFHGGVDFIYRAFDQPENVDVRVYHVLEFAYRSIALEDQSAVLPRGQRERRAYLVAAVVTAATAIRRRTAAMGTAVTCTRFGVAGRMCSG